ncbi:MAG: hypothetical protein DBY25_00495 [Clostridiales bacterium]|nr:MAG: hypothetical protein DBY25_00495 [Clostridiales bacterium]
MDTAQIVLYQAVVMFLMIVVGYICYRIHIISPTTNIQLSNLLLLVVNPCIIFISFQVDFDARLVSGLLISIGLSVLSIVLMMFLTRVVLKKKPEMQYKVDRFACIYTNCGFFATPLVSAMFGSEGVLFITAYIATSNFFMWTQGVGVYTGKMNVRQLVNCLKAPTIIAILLGVILFFCHIRIPDFVYDPIQFIGSMNSPLAMIVAGAFIAQTNVVKAFAKLRLYYVSIVRLFMIPLLCIVVFALLPLEDTVALTVLVGAAAPPAVSIMMFAAKYQCDELYAAELFSVSTIISILSIPSMCFLYTWLDGFISMFLPF